MQNSVKNTFVIELTIRMSMGYKALWTVEDVTAWLRDKLNDSPLVDEVQGLPMVETYVDSEYPFAPGVPEWVVNQFDPKECTIECTIERTQAIIEKKYSVLDHKSQFAVYFGTYRDCINFLAYREQ